MHTSYFIPGLCLLLVCTAGCSGLTDQTFTLPAGASGPPLTALWEGAVEATGIDEESSLVSDFTLIREGDGRIVLMNLYFSGDVNGERRYFEAYRRQSGAVTIRSMTGLSPAGLSHPGRVFKDLEALGSNTSFWENDWSIHLKNIRGATYRNESSPVYLLENGTLVPLDYVSTVDAPSPVYYFSFCKVGVFDGSAASGQGSGATAFVGRGECSVIFTPEELEKTSYRTMGGGEDTIPGTTTTTPPLPVTTAFTLAPGAPTPYQPAFAVGDIITDDPSDLCTGYCVVRYHPPLESYFLREVGRCTAVENATWEWEAPPVRMLHAVIDNGSYVVIEHVDDLDAIVGPIWTLT